MFEVGKHYKSMTSPQYITVLAEVNVPGTDKPWVVEEDFAEEARPGTLSVLSARVFTLYQELTQREWDAVVNPPKFEAGKFYLSRAGHMWAVRALNEKGESIVECVTTDGVPSCFAAQATTLGNEWGEISKDEWERTRTWRENRGWDGKSIWGFSATSMLMPTNGPYAIHRAMLPFGEPDLATLAQLGWPTKLP